MPCNRDEQAVVYISCSAFDRLCVTKRKVICDQQSEVGCMVDSHMEIDIGKCEPYANSKCSHVEILLQQQHNEVLHAFRKGRLPLVCDHGCLTNG